MPKFVAAMYVKQNVFVEIEAPDRNSAWEILRVDIQPRVRFEVYDAEMYTTEEFEDEFDSAAEVLSGHQEVAEVNYFPQGNRIVGQFDMLDGTRYVIEADNAYKVDELFHQHRKGHGWDDCSED